MSLFLNIFLYSFCLLFSVSHLLHQQNISSSLSCFSERPLMKNLIAILSQIFGSESQKSWKWASVYLFSSGGLDKTYLLFFTHLQEQFAQEKEEIGNGEHLVECIKRGKPGRIFRKKFIKDSFSRDPGFLQKCPKRSPCH